MQRRAGWVKYCLGCGVVAVIVISIAAYAGFRWVQGAVGKSFSMDPARVTARAAELVPGAAPPAGYQGQLLMDFGDDMTLAAFGPTGKSLGDRATTLMVLSVSSKGKSHDQIQAEASQAFQKGRGKDSGDTEVLSSQPVEVKVGTTPTQGIERDVRRNGKEELQLSVLATRPGDDKHVIVLFAQGPKQSFDRDAMEAFLSKLQVTPLSVEATPPPTGTPDDET